MDQNTRKFRLRLNLFDCIILVAALAVAAFLLWENFKPAEAVKPTQTSSTIQYTLRFQRVMEGTGALVHAGDKLEDTMKNYALGTVLSAETAPATASVLDQSIPGYVTTEVPGYEDVTVVVESSCTETDTQILLGGNYELRVGATVYLRGPGYMASGLVINIDRGV